MDNPKKSTDPRDTLRAEAQAARQGSSSAHETVGGFDAPLRSPRRREPTGSEADEGSTAGHVPVFFNFIHGQERAATDNELFDNLNPAAARFPIGRFPRSDAQDARKAIESCASAFPAWRDTNTHKRAKRVQKLADLMESQLKELARTIRRETGKTAVEAEQEARAAVVILRQCAAMVFQPDGKVYRSTVDKRMTLTRRKPLGVAVVISPFIFPLALPCWKLAPALISGNACLLKPSEHAPHTASLLGILAQHAGFPPGALNVLHGPGEPLCEELCSNPAVAVISYTGGEAGARRVGVECGRAGKRFQTDTSGKNCVFVMDDADLEQAVDLTVSGAYKMAGQNCLSTSRAIVHARAMEEFRARLKEKIAAIQVGDPRDPKSFLGPMISARALERMLRAEEEALSTGAEHVAKPAPLPAGLDYGYYAAPRALQSVSPRAILSRAETSGPILSLHSFKTLEEGAQIANATPYGLSASIFAKDVGAAMTLAEKLDVGIARVNGTTTGLEPHIPISGAKESGVNSVSFGSEIFDFFSQLQTMYLDFA